MLWTHVATGVAAAVVAAAGTWQTQEWRYGAKEALRLDAVAKAEAKVVTVVKPAAIKHEAAKESIRIKYVKVTETVDRIVDRPIYKNVCLDAEGVDVINSGMRP